MLPSPDINSFFELIKLIGAGKLTGDALKEAKKEIIKFLAKNEYGFTPDKDLAIELQQIKNSELYNRFKGCVGKSPCLSLVKLGLTFEGLSEEGREEKIRRIKDEVFRSPKFGIKGIAVLNMGSTGVLPEIIHWISDKKINNNYSTSIMSDIFDGVVERWERDTIFHQTSDGSTKLELKLIAYMNSGKDLFFVFAGGMAAEQAMKKIATLKKKKEFRNRGYNFELIGRKVIEISDKKLLAWAFEKSKSSI